MKLILYIDFNHVTHDRDNFLNLPTSDIGKKYCEISIPDEDEEKTITELTAKGCKITGIEEI